MGALGPWSRERPLRSMQRDTDEVLRHARTVLSNRGGGGRSWWAHLEFTRLNITPTILHKKIEDLMNVRGVGEKSFLKLKPLVTVSATKGESAGQ